MSISREILEKFLDMAVVELKGDWVILGGSVPHLLGASTRPTMDIDLAGPENATQSDTLKLMDIATSLSLPIEAINQAAAFFLYRIPEWKKHIVLVRQGLSGAIHRPDIELYFRLKLQRANEADISDLKAMLDLEESKAEVSLILKQICRESIESRPSAETTAVERIRRLSDLL